MDNAAFFIFFAVIEFMHGFSLSVFSFLTAKNIFGINLNKYLLISLFGGILFSSAVLVPVVMGNTADLSLILLGYSIYIILVGWLISAKKDKNTIFPLFLAFVFSYSMINIFSAFVFSVTRASGLFELIPVFAELISYILIYLLSILFIFLLSKILCSQESLTIWNMVLISVVAFVVPEVLIRYAITDSITDIDPESAVPLLLGFLFVTVTVVLSVKSAQNRYLSKINKLSEIYLESQAKHFESVRDNDTEIRRINHDMKNHFICLNQLYRTENFDELGKYIEKLCDTVSAVKSDINTGNEIADAIISEKSKSYGITIKTEGDFSAHHISSIDLCTILSNLLDNACEAVSDNAVSDKSIFVSCKGTPNFRIISVSNKTSHKMDIENGMPTSKADNKSHGFGIGNVKKAVQKYNGEVIFSYEKSDDGYLFIAEVMIPAKN